MKHFSKFGQSFLLKLGDFMSFQQGFRMFKAFNKYYTYNIVLES